MKIRLSALILISALLPACADQTGPVDGLAHDWTLARIDGRSVDYRANMTLAEPGKITGQAPCNRYFAAVRINGAAFTVGPIAATKMACPDLAGEAAFFQALELMTMIEVGTGELRLSGGGREMVFHPRE